MRKIRLTQSERCGLIFPVARFTAKLKKLPSTPKRVSKLCGAHLTAVLEYLAAEVIELSGNICKEFKKKRITPRHIKLAIMHDLELEKLLRDIVIPQGGVLPTSASMVPTAPKPKKLALKMNAPKHVSHVQNKGVTTLSQRVLEKGQKLSVLQADLTDVKADAYVTHAYLGGMVGGAISRKGGPEMQLILNQHVRKFLNTSDVDMTDASKSLLCSKIIHVSSPSWDASKQTQKVNELSAAVENILCIAETHRLKSIALPSISSGGNMYPKQLAAQTILRAINKHFKKQEQHDNMPTKPSSIQEVFFVLYDKESVDVYISELGKLVIN